MGASTWVPLVTAAAGLIAGLAAGLVSTVLARRWSREDQAAAWQREDALRWHQDRLQLYARMVTALDAWEAELGRAMAGGTPSFDAAEWERHDQAIIELLGLVFLMAPEKVSDLARKCYVAFARAGDVLAAGGYPGGMRAAAEQAPRATRRLVEAMRADLGLELGGGQAAAGAEPRPAG